MAPGTRFVYLLAVFVTYGVHLIPAQFGGSSIWTEPQDKWRELVNQSPLSRILHGGRSGRNDLSGATNIFGRGPNEIDKIVSDMANNIPSGHFDLENRIREIIKEFDPTPNFECVRIIMQEISGKFGQGSDLLDYWRDMPNRYSDCVREVRGDDSDHDGTSGSGISNGDGSDHDGTSGSGINIGYGSEHDGTRGSGISDGDGSHHDGTDDSGISDGYGSEHDGTRGSGISDGDGSHHDGTDDSGISNGDGSDHDDTSGSGGNTGDGSDHDDTSGSGISNDDGSHHDGTSGSGISDGDGSHHDGTSDSWIGNGDGSDHDDTSGSGGNTDYGTDHHDTRWNEGTSGSEEGKDHLELHDFDPVDNDLELTIKHFLKAFSDLVGMDFSGSSQEIENQLDKICSGESDSDSCKMNVFYNPQDYKSLEQALLRNHNSGGGNGFPVNINWGEGSLGPWKGIDHFELHGFVPDENDLELNIKNFLKALSDLVGTDFSRSSPEVEKQLNNICSGESDSNSCKISVFYNPRDYMKLILDLLRNYNSGSGDGSQ